MNMQKFLQAADSVYKNPIWSSPVTAVDRITLVANTPKLYTLPANVEFILLNSIKSIYVLFGLSDVVATIPDEYDSDILDGSSPMLNPGLICGISFTNFTSMSLISTENTIVTIQRWSRR